MVSSTPTPSAIIGEQLWRLGLPKGTNDEFIEAAKQIIAALEFAGYKINR
jgi:hypothetical protein